MWLSGLALCLWRFERLFKLNTYWKSAGDKLVIRDPETPALQTNEYVISFGKCPRHHLRPSPLLHYDTVSRSIGNLGPGRFAMSLGTCLPLRLFPPLLLFRVGGKAPPPAMAMRVEGGGGISFSPWVVNIPPFLPQGFCRLFLVNLFLGGCSPFLCCFIFCSTCLV